MRFRKIEVQAKQFLPFLSWDIAPKILRDDLIAGITVALVLIPQAIAYAQLAGLPPEFGLYASLLPPIMAALFGSSRYLATGPVAIVSLITASTLSTITVVDKTELLTYAILLALMVGIIQLVLGSLKLGVIVNFISHPVIIGFTNAAAIIIATSQLPKIFGVYVDTYERHYETIYHFLITAAKEIHVLSIIVALYAFLAILSLKKINPKIPGVLLIVIITTYFSWAVGFERKSTAPITAIHSDQTVTAIQKYNAIVDQIEKKNSEKNNLIQKQNLLEKNDKQLTSDAVELGLTLQRTNFELEDLKSQASVYRDRLRGLQFVLEQRNASTFFTTLEENRRGINIDREIWHLKINEGSLNTTALPIVSGGSVIGKVPQGLPAIKVPIINLSVVPQLFNSALVIALLGFMESISVAKSLASRGKDKIDPNQELIGQGIANIAGSFTQSYPVAGSFSRTAVNYQSGAKSGFSSIFTSIFVLITLLFLTPLLYHLPQPVLAVIIIISVIGLIKFDKIFAAWKAHKSDGVIACITFLSTLFFAPELDKGILVGVVLSTCYYIYTRTHPRIALISRNSDGVLQDAQANKLPLCKHIIIIRFDGSLFFANAAYLENKILTIVSHHTEEITHVILDANGINYIDYTGIETIERIAENLRDAHKKFLLANLKSTIFDEIKHAGVHKKIGTNNLFKRRKYAIHAAYNDAHMKSSEQICPLISYKK